MQKLVYYRSMREGWKRGSKVKSDGDGDNGLALDIHLDFHYDEITSSASNVDGVVRDRASETELLEARVERSVPCSRCLLEAIE